MTCVEAPEGPNEVGRAPGTTCINWGPAGLASTEKYEPQLLLPSRS
jgi:hypothetical protein